jgi:hypothetical protein
MMISGFRREVDEICILLGCYAAYSSSYLQTFWDNLSVPSLRVDNLYRDVSKELLLCAAQYPTRAPVSLCVMHTEEKK